MVLSLGQLLRRGSQIFISSLLEFLNVACICREEDFRIWDGDPLGHSSVKSGIKSLHRGAIIRPSLEVICSKVPPKVQSFCWCVAKGRVLTRRKLT